VIKKFVIALWKSKLLGIKIFKTLKRQKILPE